MLEMTPELMSAVYPITGLQIVPGIGLVINRKSLLQGKPKRGDRKEIKRLSKRSLYNMLLTVKSAKEVVWKSMLTLTYSIQFPVTGKEVKRNLDYALRYVKRNCCKDLKYFWFQEFQERGAPHYHVVMDYLPSDSEVIKFVVYWVNLQGLHDWEYCRISDHRLFHVKQSAIDFNSHVNELGQFDVWQELRNKEDGAARYALKYASKPKQKTTPFWYRDVGRFWGTNLPKPDTIYVDCCEGDLRQHLSTIGHPIANWDYLPKIILYRDSPH